MKPIIICCLLLFVLAGCGGGGGKASPTPKSGKGEVSPAFNLTGVDGSTISLKPTDNPNGDVTLLIFWSFRFDPNVKTLLSRASELHERYAPRGLRIIAVTYDEEPTDLRSFLAQNKTPFAIAVGVPGTYPKFEVKSIPTTILIDKSGKIVDRWEGHFTVEEQSARLTPYLPGRSGNSGS